jgi:ATP-dependent DNA helicase RecG
MTPLKASEKVSDFIKNKETKEILEFYQLLSLDGFLTNLGILWLGKPQQRAALSYPVTIQYIVYNEKRKKSGKKSGISIYTAQKNFYRKLKKKRLN